MAIAKHKHERFLREQRDWFSASFAAIPDGVIATDGAGKVCYLNPAAERMCDWKADDALRQPLTKVMPLFA